MARAVHAHEPADFRETVVVGADRPGITERAEIFRGVKAQTSGEDRRAGALSMAFRPDRLGCVLDYLQIVPGGDFVHCLQVRHLSEEIDGNDRPRFGGDLFLKGGDVDVKRRRLNIGENDFGARPRDRSGRREKREGGADHFIARLQAQGHQRTEERVASAADADRMLYAAVRGQVFLKFFDMRPQHQRLVIENFIQRGANLFADWRVLRL